jgi:hypothetical protein
MPAEQVGVDDRQQPHGDQPARVERGQRDRRPSTRMQRLGDQEELHVQPEAVEDRGERRLRVAQLKNSA